MSEIRPNFLHHAIYLHGIKLYQPEIVLHLLLFD